MKRILSVIFLFPCILFTQVSTDPNQFEVNQSVTITVDINSTETDCNSISNPNTVYMHAGIGDESSPWGFSVVGNWGQDDGVGEMNDNGDGTWSITIIPENYFGLNSDQASSVVMMGMVFRNENGSQELKDQGCLDFFINVECVLGIPETDWPQNIVVFCDQENLSIVDLGFEQTANSRLWYETETSQTPIPESTELVNEETYYVSNYNPESGCESERLAITVMIGETPLAPTGPSIQTFNEEDEPTISDLVANGENIQWYYSSTNNNLIEADYILNNNEVIYSTQTVNGCESEEFLSVTIQIEDLTEDDPPIITSTGSRIYCQQTQQYIVSSFNISDPDNTTLDALYVQISQGYIPGEDILSLAIQMPGISTSWNAQRRCQRKSPIFWGRQPSSVTRQ